jgi:hypothetical protein
MFKVFSNMKIKALCSSRRWCPPRRLNVNQSPEDQVETEDLFIPFTNQYYKTLLRLSIREDHNIKYSYTSNLNLISEQRVYLIRVGVDMESSLSYVCAI